MKYHIRPLSLSHSNHCQPVINVCNCTSECICQPKCIEPCPLPKERDCCNSLQNKVSFDICSPKRVYNPIITCCDDLTKNIIENNNQNNNCYRTYSNIDLKANNPEDISGLCNEILNNKSYNYKRNSLIDHHHGISNKCCKENLNKYLDDYCNKGKKYKNSILFRNYRNERIRNKLKGLSKNMCDELLNNELSFNNKKKILDRIKHSKDMDSRNNLYKKINNELLENRKNSISSCNTSQRDESTENNDKLAKIIIDKEIKNKDLLDEICKCRRNYNCLKNEFKKIYEENETLKKIACCDDESNVCELKEGLKKLCKKLKLLQNEYNKLKTDNNECKNNYDDLLDKYYRLEKENKRLKKELDKNNSIDKDYDDMMRKMNKLEKENEKLKRINDELENELRELKEKDENNLRNIQKLNNKLNMLNMDKDEIEDLNNKLKKLQRELNNALNELNENENLKDKNMELYDENKELKNIIEKYKKELEDLKKRRYSKKNTGNFEEELVIVNKEVTYNNGSIGGEINKKNEAKKNINNPEIKKNIDLTENELYKYHEIIQDLTNMILIYENFYFKKKAKPKNNNELISCLLVNFLDKKIKKIKLNAFIKILIHNAMNQKNNNKSKRSSFFNEKDYDNFYKRKGIGFGNKFYKKGYYNERNSSQNSDKIE